MKSSRERSPTGLENATDLASPESESYPAFSSEPLIESLSLLHLDSSNHENIDPVTMQPTNLPLESKTPSVAARGSEEAGPATKTRESKSPLPPNYPRVPLQDITDVLAPPKNKVDAGGGLDKKTMKKVVATAATKAVATEPSGCVAIQGGRLRREKPTANPTDSLRGANLRSYR